MDTMQINEVVFNFEKKTIEIKTKDKKQHCFKGNLAVEYAKKILLNNKPQKTMKNLPMKEAIELLKAIDTVLLKNQQQGAITLNIIEDEINIIIGVDDPVVAVELKTISPKIEVLNF